MTVTEVRPLRAEDRAVWQPLWDDYLIFYRKDLDSAVTDDAFRRLAGEEDGMFGLLGVDGDAAVGFAHALTHPSTWSTASYVYLEDLFVVPAARGTGAARGLIEAVYAQAEALGADRVYWHTQEDNAAARGLYDRVGHRTSFIVYER